MESNNAPFIKCVLILIISKKRRLINYIWNWYTFALKKWENQRFSVNIMRENNILFYFTLITLNTSYFACSENHIININSIWIPYFESGCLIQIKSKWNFKYGSNPTVEWISPWRWSVQWSGSMWGGQGWWRRLGWSADSNCSCQHTQTDSTWGSAPRGTAERTTPCRAIENITWCIMHAYGP